MVCYPLLTPQQVQWFKYRSSHCDHWNCGWEKGQLQTDGNIVMAWSHGYSRFLEPGHHCKLVFCSGGVYSKVAVLQEYCCSCRAPPSSACRTDLLNAHLCSLGLYMPCSFLLTLLEPCLLHATPGALCCFWIVCKHKTGHPNSTWLHSLLLLAHAQRYLYLIPLRTVTMKFQRLKLSSSSQHSPSSLSLSALGCVWFLFMWRISELETEQNKEQAPTPLQRKGR